MTMPNLRRWGALLAACALLIATPGVASAGTVGEPTPPPIVTEVEDGSKNVTSVPWSEHDAIEKMNASVEKNAFPPGVETKEQPAIDRYLKELAKWVGYREKPVNLTVFGKNYIAPGHPNGWNGVAWCSIFLSVTGRWAGIGTKILPQSAYVPGDRAYAKSVGRYDATPHKGDWIFYGPRPSHIEAVESVDKTTVTTIGGNTTNGRGSPEGVWRKRLLRTNSRISGYYHPDWLNAGKGKPSGPDNEQEGGGTLPRTGVAADMAKVAVGALGVGVVLVLLSLAFREAYRGVHRRRARHHK